MPPSQAMSNQGAPSVRQHPPGLVCSLLASAACHGLALTVCLPSTFFPPHGMQMLCLCLALSVWLPQLSSSLTSHWPSHLHQMGRLFEKSICQKIKKLKLKRNFCWQENKVRSNLSSCLFLDSISFSCCAIFPSTPFTFFFPCAYFHQTHSCYT